jgi:microsomal epoxide hydrolase
MSSYANIPSNASLNVKPFEVYVEEERLEHFKALLDLSPIAPSVFENTNAGTTYGITREWLDHAKQEWLHTFDWRKHEERINSFPSFIAPVQDEGGNAIGTHFLALFSEKKDAVPIVFLHGWPDSNCQFLEMLAILKSQYSPKDLPYHVIVPSLPGYGYSSGLPLHVDYNLDLAASVIHNLMVGLGFGSGYLTQGGDLGSFISRILVMKYDACKGMHVNMMGIPPQQELGTLPKSEAGERVMRRAAEFMDTGNSFLLEQGTRPSTLGLALSSSPLAVLSW